MFVDVYSSCYIVAFYIFKADIKPQTDGCNGLKYNLTPDIIACIFKTYPAVKRKHQENVPHKMPESEFWTKFFQSHYFHRDRINAGTKDLFTECAKIDDQEMKKDLQTGINDPLLDITSFEDKNLDENYGSEVGRADKPSGNIVHQSMIKRFNQHSIMVMKASTAKYSNTTTEPQMNGSTPSSSNNSNTNQHSDEPKSKKVSFIFFYSFINSYFKIIKNLSMEKETLSTVPGFEPGYY